MASTTLASTPGAIAVTPLSKLAGPDPHWLFGNLKQIETQRFHAQMEEWAQQYGAYFRVRLGQRDALVLSDPATTARLMRERPDNMRRASRVAAMLNEVGARGVFTAEGDDWRAQRKLVMRSLTPEVIRNFFSNFVTLAERLRVRWQRAVERGEQIDLLHDLGAFSLDAIVHLAMGHDINTLEGGDNQLQRDIEFIFARVAKRITSPIPYWRYIKLAVDRETDAAADRIMQAVHQFIAQERRRIEDNPALRQRPTNMLQALIVARDEEGSGFTDDDVIGNTFTMVFAGEDTTSHTIAWLIHHLSLAPAAEAELHKEAAGVLGADRVLTGFSRLDAFPYLDAATNEAMRLTPVAPMMTLETLSDSQIGNVQVPAGTPVVLLLREVSRNGDFGSEPDDFMPSRWIERSANPAEGDLSRQMFPFGGGARFCPGRYLAMAEIRIVMSMLARNFELVRDTSAPPVRDLFVYTMNPDSLPVSLKLRP
ncbi:cytochrome P450 [Noviherbaspirillum galbum]|uniref:Cytochrome P450 n=1 Tax=Noviherbaspirillum galbum TaxID=2709383 RepID=A0A6B3SHB3_9BURK|nr:cytochrome P450 [Noviherbaspirillum galbum]NEX60040.1 cytochrome P450 [Noviherbaspirillum galbum]